MDRHNPRISDLQVGFIKVITETTESVYNLKTTVYSLCYESLKQISKISWQSYINKWLAVYNGSWDIDVYLPTFLCRKLSFTWDQMLSCILNFACPGTSTNSLKFSNLTLANVQILPEFIKFQIHFKENQTVRKMNRVDKFSTPISDVKYNFQFLGLS